MNDKQYREGGVWILQRYFERKGNNAHDFFNNFRNELLQVAENDIHLIQYHRSHILKVIKLVDCFNLDRRNLIVDVGGFDGEVAKLFATSIPESTILTFEPIKSNFNTILRTTSGIGNVLVRNVGLGEFSKTVSINKTSNLPSSSILAISKEISEGFFVDKLSVDDQEEIVVQTLDKEVDEKHIVNILKIDVQGYELKVLQGAIKTLDRTNIVLIELQNHSFYEQAPQYHELDKFLRDNDFLLFDLIPALRKGNKLYEWDAIYVKSFLTHV